MNHRVILKGIAHLAAEGLKTNRYSESLGLSIIIDPVEKLTTGQPPLPPGAKRTIIKSRTKEG